MEETVTYKTYEKMVNKLLKEEDENMFKEEFDTEGNLISRDYQGRIIRIKCEKCNKILLEVFEPDIIADRQLWYWDECKHFRIEDWTEDSIEYYWYHDQELYDEFEKERAEAIYETRADGKYVFIIPKRRNK